MEIHKSGGTREIYHPSDSTKPLVSIIVVTLNAEAHLRNCLLSIVGQHYQNLELLIFDGGSTDSTLSIIEEFTTQITFWKSGPDKGIYDAMNMAIKQAKGDWLYFLGADDKLLPAFSDLANKIRDKNVVYYGMCEPIGILFTGRYNSYKLSKYNMNHQALLYPKVVFNDSGYNTRFNVYADYELNIRVWGNRAIKKKYYPFVIAEYNMNGFSSTGDDPAFKAVKSELIRQHLGWFTYLRYRYKKRRESLKPGSTFF